MSWRSVSLGDGINVKHGFAFKGEFFSDAGELMVLTPGNFLEKGGFRSREGKERFYHSGFSQEYLLSKGDLIVAMTEQGEGLLGSAARIPADGKYLHNQRIGLVQITNKKLFDKKFLYWVFNSPGIRAQIRATSTGTKVKHTAPKRIQNIRFLAPDLDDQVAISSVLDSYNDLIATSERRIALLEEAAHLLYREWFVHFRFPGHDTVKKVGGEFDGWRSGTFGDTAQVRRGKNITKQQVAEGHIPVVAAGLEPACYHKVANAKGPVITISASGANAGFVNLHYTDIWASDCSYISSEFTDHIFYQYCVLAARQRELTHMQKGTAQPHVYPKDIQSMKVVTPPPELVDLFQEVIASSFAMIGVLKMQNAKLGQTRDAILPKLMSGQLDASSIRFQHAAETA